MQKCAIILMISAEDASRFRDFSMLYQGEYSPEDDARHGQGQYHLSVTTTTPPPPASGAEGMRELMIDEALDIWRGRR